MTEQEAEGAEEQPEADETTENDSDEQPEIEADERADMGELADLAEQVEEEAGADTDDSSDDAEEAPAEDGETAPAAPSEAGTADWGDLYVGTVTTGLNAVIEEYGRDDADKIDESLARDLHLDDYVNEWMAQQGKAEMDPAQGMLVATAALCATVLVSRTDLPNKAIQKVQNDA